MAFLSIFTRASAWKTSTLKPTRLYRRHRLIDRKIKTVITFKQMSVNRQKYCQSPHDVLINSKEGGHHQGFGVVSFSVADVQSLKWTDQSENAAQSSALVRHDIQAEPCNYSHSLVCGCVDGKELLPGEELPKTVRKELRRQLFRAVVTELPPERLGETLDADSWQ